MKTSGLHQTKAKKYADYILQRNESFKRKAENEVVEQKQKTIGIKAVGRKEKKIFSGG